MGSLPLEVHRPLADSEPARVPHVQAQGVRPRRARGARQRHRLGRVHSAGPGRLPSHARGNLRYRSGKLPIRASPSAVESQTRRLRHLAVLSRTDGSTAWRGWALSVAAARWRQSQPFGLQFPICASSMSNKVPGIVRVPSFNLIMPFSLSILLLIFLTHHRLAMPFGNRIKIF